MNLTELNRVYDNKIDWIEDGRIFAAHSLRTLTNKIGEINGNADLSPAA